MKKMNNKGFSLVELIIVIAIMAILAGAIAPALIRYIDKSRKSNDVSAGKTIKTAVETAMGNERTYELLINSGNGSTIEINPGSGATEANAVKITGATVSDTVNNAESEIGLNIGEKTPKFKYTKNKPTQFIVTVTAGGTVKVYIKGQADTNSSNAEIKAGLYQIAPELCDEYQ